MSTSINAVKNHTDSIANDDGFSLGKTLECLGDNIPSIATESVECGVDLYKKNGSRAVVDCGQAIIQLTQCIREGF